MDDEGEDDDDDDDEDEDHITTELPILKVLLPAVAALVLFAVAIHTVDFLPCGRKYGVLDQSEIEPLPIADGHAETIQSDATTQQTET